MKRSIAIIVAGFVTTVTIMGGTLVAAQTGAFTSVSASVQPNGEIRVLHNDTRNPAPLTDTIEIRYYTETEQLDSHGPPEVVFTDTTNVGAPFETKLYEAYEKLRGGMADQDVDGGDWGISGTMTTTHHEHEVDVNDGIHMFTDTITGTHHHEIHEINDDGFKGFTDTITDTYHQSESGSDHDLHVLTDTLTHTNHLDVKDEHGGEIHLGDENHNITGTIDITSTRHGDNKSVDVSRQGQNTGHGGANTRQNSDNSGNNNNRSGQGNNSGRGDRRKP